MVYNLIGELCGLVFSVMPVIFSVIFHLYRKNLKLLIVAIIVVSILPAVIEVGRISEKLAITLKSNISKQFIQITFMKNSFLVELHLKDLSFFPYVETFV